MVLKDFVIIHFIFKTLKIKKDANSKNRFFKEKY